MIKINNSQENHPKNRECGKEIPQNSDSRQPSTSQGKGASENPQKEHDTSLSIKSFAIRALSVATTALPFLFAASIPLAEGAETNDHAIVPISSADPGAIALFGSIAAVYLSALSTIALFGAALDLARRENALPKQALSDCAYLPESEEEMFKAAKKAHQRKLVKDKLLAKFNTLEKRFTPLAKQISPLGPEHSLQKKLKQFEQKYLHCQSSLDSSSINQTDAKETMNELEEALTRPEEEFQEVLKAIAPTKELSHLIASPSTPINKKLFQHILGDYWGKNTGLEGYDSELMIHHFEQFIQQKIKSSKDESLRPLRQEFEEAKQLTAAFLREPIQTFRDKLKATLFQKKPGESTFFMTGWQNKQGGHATAFRITVEENGLYTLSIFNRGSGMHYHAETILLGEQQSLPFLEIKEVEKSNLFDEVLLQALREMEAPPLIGIEWSASDLYQGILPLFGNKQLRKKFDIYPPEKTMEQLQVGHCTYLALTGILHESIPDSYERFIFDLQLKTISDFFEQNHLHLTKDPRKRSLLFKGAQQLSRNAEKIFQKKGLLTLKELNLVNERLSIIFNALDESEKETPEQELYIKAPWEDTKNIPLHYDTEKSFDTSSGVSDSLSLPLDVSSFDAAPTQFPRQCKEWQSHFAKTNEKALFTQTKELIHDWVRKIPIRWLESSIDWEKELSAEAAADVLTALASISEDLLWAHMSLAQQADRSKIQDPVNLFSIIKLLSIADAISKAFKDSTGAHLQGLYQFNFDLLFEQSGSVLLFDPELDEQVRWLKAYWEKADPVEERKNRSHISFFGVEATPLGRGDRTHYGETSNEEKCNDYFHFQWPYLSWIRTFLQTPQGAEKITVQFPDLAKKNIRTQANEILGKKGLLPPGFEALSTLSWISNAFFQPPPTKAYLNRGLGIETIIYSSWNSRCGIPIHSETKNLFGITFQYPSDIHIEAEYLVNYFERTFPRGNSALAKQIDSNYFIENAQDLPTSLLSIYGDNHTIPHFDEKTRSLIRKRLGPHLRHEISLVSETGMNDEQMQDLLSLSAVRELQVVETLAYFTNRFELLQQRDYQIFFRNLIAQPPLLHEQLLHDPSFAIKLASFAKRGYELNQQLSNEQTAEFFLDLNRYFSATARHAGLSIEEAGFLDTRQELLQFIEKHKDLPSEQSPYWLDIAALLDPASLDEQGAIDLLSAYAHLKLYPISETHPSYSKSEALRFIDHLMRFQGPLAKILSSPSKDRILNALLHSLYPGRGSFEWDQTNHPTLFHTRSSFNSASFSINIASGAIYQGHVEMISMPEELQKHRLLKPIFEKEQIEAIDRLSPNSYQLTFANGLKMRILIGSQLTIQREIKPGLWAQYSNPTDEIPKGLLWPDGEVLREHTSGPRQTFWIANSSGDIHYRIEYKTTWDSTTLLVTRPIVRILPSGEEWTLYLPTKESALGQLEEPGFALIWQNKEGKTVSVELPRYQLEFIDHGRGLETKQLPGFILQNKSPVLPSEIKPIIVEKEGKRKFLFLNPIYQTSKIFQDSGRSFFQYEETKRGLRALKNEDRLFLSFIELQGEQYDKAHSLFTHDKSQLRAYTEEEKAILQMIVTPESADFEDKDFSPSSVAIRLRALYMLKRDEMDFQGIPTKLKKEEIEPLVWLYVQHHREVPVRFRLLADEEKWLLKSLDLQSLLLLQRKDILSKNPLKTPSFGANPSQLQESTNLNDTLFESYLWKWGTSDIPINQSLLRRSGLRSQFNVLFEIARGAADEQQYRKWLKDLLGKDPDDHLSLEELSEKIERALSLIAMSRTDITERASAMVLLTVLKNKGDQDLEDFILLGPNKKRKDSFSILVMKTLKTLNSLSLLKPAIQEGNLLPLDPDPLILQPCPPFQHPQFVPYNFSLPEGMLIKEEIPGQKAPAELSRLFDLPIEDRAIHSHLNSLSLRLRDYSSEPKVHYRLENKETLATWKEQIANTIDNLRSEISQEEAKLLELANKNYANPTDHELRRAKLKAGSEDPVSIEELILLPAYADSTLLVKRNPALSCEEAEAILQKTQTFLLKATHLQHLERLSKNIAQMELLKAPEEIALALEEIGRMAESKRAYDLKEHPEYLVFEFHMNLLLWPEQGANLEKLRKLGTALEMIMGGGKSSVLTPLLAFKCADGDSLCVQIMPESLIPSMSEALKSTLWKSFSKMIELVEVNRKTPLQKEDLERLYSRLENVIVERKVVVMSASSLQSLLLRFVEALEEEKTSEIELYQKIFQLMRKKGILTMDELDLLVDVLKAHHFSRGKKQKMHEDRIVAVSHLYKLLLSDADLKGAIRWNFLPDLGGKDPLTKESYAKFQPILIKKLLSSELAPEEESKRFFANLTHHEKSLLVAYLKKEKISEAARFVANIPSKRVKNLLADWKEEVGELLSLTGSAQVDENYGENPNIQSPMAIPFHGIEMPAVQSIHGLDLEILNYSIQMYLAKGLKLSMIETEINRLKNVIQTELNNNTIKHIEESPHYADFLRLTGEQKSYKLFSLTQHQLEQILERVNQDPQIRLDFVTRHQLPAILRFTKELHTNNHAASLLFPRKKGFSGTFWNANSYPTAFIHKDLSNTEVQTLQLLWEQKTPVSIMNKQSSLQKNIEKLYGTHRGSLADRGGVLRGFDGETVARAIFALPIWKESKVKGIVYYDQEGQKKVLLKETLESILFEESGLSKEEIIAYWSQKYTTGSDIPLAAKMKTVVTVGRATTMRDLLQTVWRNRNLHRGQTISMVVANEDALVMRETLSAIGAPVEEDLTLSHIFLYVKYIEAAKQGNYNLRALRFNLENVMLDSFFDKLFNEKKPLSLFNELEEYFFQTKPEEPYDENGTLEELLSGEEIIESEIARLRASTDFQKRSAKEKASIETAWREIAKDAIEHLPQLSSRRMNMGTEVQTEQEAENETEMQQQTIKEIENSSKIEPKALYVWKEENLFSAAYFKESITQEAPKWILTIPDFERLNQPDHPLDRLWVFGKDALAELGIRPLRKLGMGSDLFISLNADPTHKAKELLVIRDKASKQIQVMLLNQWDALMFLRLLEKDRLEPIEGKREVQIALYHTELGFFAQGSDPIDPAIEESLEFLHLKLQADFFNGKSNYSASELKILRMWIKKVGSKKLEELFINTILKNKPASASAYKGSTLANLFLLEKKDF